MTDTMFQHSSSFDFLEQSYPELASLARAAERYAYTDHSVFLLKIRIFLEIWCHEVGYQKAKDTTIEERLFQKIEQLDKLQCIEQSTRALLHELRVLCNQGVHLSHHAERGFCHIYSLTDHDIQQSLHTLFQLALLLAPSYQANRQLGYAPCKQAELEALVAPAFLGDGDAACKLAKRIHEDLTKKKKQSAYSERDLQHWLQKALQAGCVAAVDFLSALVFEKQYRCFDLKQLQHWLQHFLQQQPVSPELLLVSAQTHEKLGSFPKALHHYQQAAEQGSFNAIKRLREYWINRDLDKFYDVLVIGNRFGERHSVYYLMTYLMIARRSPDVTDENRKLYDKDIKSQRTKIKSFGVDGLEYIQAVEQLFDWTDEGASIQKGCVDAIASGWRHAPRFGTFDKYVFRVLAQNGVEEPFMVPLAESALPTIKDNKDRGFLEMDLAILMVNLTGARKIFNHKFSSRELLKSASKRGLSDATKLLVALNSRTGKYMTRMHG